MIGDDTALSGSTARKRLDRNFAPEGPKKRISDMRLFLVEHVYRKATSLSLHVHCG